MTTAEERQKILIVDDQSENLQILMETLKADHMLVAARSGGGYIYHLWERPSVWTGPRRKRREFRE